ncbi:hypothetical protein, variant 2 [Verruconis gallopava]|nr:hypothetical protein, variant 1 [Verruconis gallopava]XP_016214631.1 hypothetical protein, variant 2 [Verruconis gallopava]KIW04761.1 hypothetical protein, variant 1 [Verruconis gallopava]KIW04762.1 hypothetical protein, variant 2 [Verruconis gallopava]
MGMILGQLSFGLLGDTLGRHRVYGRELIVTTIGTLMCILLPWRGLSHSGVIAWLSCWRVFTGFGIGGDYPMSSALAAEKAPIGSRAVMVLIVFSCIGLGAITSSIVYLILLTAFKSSIDHDINNLEYVWRLLLGLGIVPCAMTVYARLKIKETLPYKQYVLKRDELLGKDKRRPKDQMQDFKSYFSKRKHARVLFAVSAVWFLFDIAFYGINLNQSVILGRIGYGRGPTPYQTLRNTAVGNIIVQSAGYLPGYWIGIFLPDWIGRIRLQFWGSLLVAAVYAIWAGITNHTNTAGLTAIFAVSQLVLNSSVNVTTFLLPVEVFPTRVRGTAHGIAAASGKVGAIITAMCFGTVNEKIGIQGNLGLFAGIMVLAALCTLLIPETKGKTIEEIEHGVLYGHSIQDRTVTYASSVDDRISYVEHVDANYGEQA